MVSVHLNLTLFSLSHKKFMKMLEPWVTLTWCRDLSSVSLNTNSNTKAGRVRTKVAELAINTITTPQDRYHGDDQAAAAMVIEKIEYIWKIYVIWIRSFGNLLFTPNNIQIKPMNDEALIPNNMKINYHVMEKVYSNKIKYNDNENPR